MFNMLISAISGTFAGVINGFIGTGGGIILIYVFTKMMGPERTKDAFVSVIAAILPMSAVSVIIYCINGNIDPGRTAVYIIPAVVGGFFGAVLLNKIKINLLKMIFSILVIYAGIRMLVC